MKVKLIFIIASILIFNGCIFNCDDVKENILKLEFKQKVTEKSKDRLIFVRGITEENKIVEFKEFEYWGIYEYIELGDTLYKEFGKTELVLIKKDSTLIFPLYCDGEMIK